MRFALLIRYVAHKATDTPDKYLASVRWDETKPVPNTNYKFDPRIHRLSKAVKEGLDVHEYGEFRSWERDNPGSVFLYMLTQVLRDNPGLTICDVYEGTTGSGGVCSEYKINIRELVEEYTSSLEIKEWNPELFADVGGPFILVRRAKRTDKHLVYLAALHEDKPLTFDPLGCILNRRNREKFAKCVKKGICNPADVRQLTTNKGFQDVIQRIRKQNPELEKLKVFVGLHPPEDRIYWITMDGKKLPARKPPAPAPEPLCPNKVILIRWTDCQKGYFKYLDVVRLPDPEDEFQFDPGNDSLTQENMGKFKYRKRYGYFSPLNRGVGSPYRGLLKAIYEDHGFESMMVYEGTGNDLHEYLLKFDEELLSEIAFRPSWGNGGHAMPKTARRIGAIWMRPVYAANLGYGTQEVRDLFGISVEKERELAEKGSIPSRGKHAKWMPPDWFRALCLWSMDTYGGLTEKAVRVTRKFQSLSFLTEKGKPWADVTKTGADWLSAVPELNILSEEELIMKRESLEGGPVTSKNPEQEISPGVPDPSAEVPKDTKVNKPIPEFPKVNQVYPRLLPEQSEDATLEGRTVLGEDYQMTFLKEPLRCVLKSNMNMVGSCVQFIQIGEGMEFAIVLWDSKAIPELLIREDLQRLIIQLDKL